MNTILLNENSIYHFSEKTILESRINIFYNKVVFFTQKLRGPKFNQFQVIGNLGGIPNDTDLSLEIDFFIISDKIIEELRNGLKDQQINEIEKLINQKAKRNKDIYLLTESDFLRFVNNRCQAIGDKVTLKLIEFII